MKISVINGEVFIDGKSTGQKSVELEVKNFPQSDFKWVRIMQFTSGTQGTCSEIEKINTQVFESCTEYPTPAYCANFPIMLRKYNWISYRGFKVEVGIWNDEYSVTLPSEDILRKYIKDNNIDVGQAYAAFIDFENKVK